MVQLVVFGCWFVVQYQFVEFFEDWFEVCIDFDDVGIFVFCCEVLYDIVFDEVVVQCFVFVFDVFWQEWIVVGEFGDGFGEMVLFGVYGVFFGCIGVCIVCIVELVVFVG